MRILGLVGATHDSGIALLDNGEIELVLEEERLNRKKRTMAFPARSLVTAFGQDGAGLKDIDVMVTPWDVKRLRRSFLRAVFGQLPASLSLIAESTHSLQRNEIAILNYYIKRRLRRRFPLAKPPPLVNVGHHDAHAALFFMCPFDRAAVLVMDGYGDDAATSVYAGQGNDIARRWSTSFFNSLGMVYTFVTSYLGFRPVADEGKVMALAAYGDSSLVEKFRDTVRLAPGGRYSVNMEYFSFDKYGEWWPFTSKFYEVFGPPRERTAPIEDRHRAVAYALQRMTEEVIVHMVREISEQQQTDKLVFSGGVALNCVANARILSDTPIREIWVPPAASDTGTPLGACLWHHHKTIGYPRSKELKHAFYGLQYSEKEIDAAISAAGLSAQQFPDDSVMYAAVAHDLTNGKVVGWFQGRFEMGPRALGNRSILADPRRAEMRDIINSKIKQRESFRPFAPAILAERAADYFAINQGDPFMTLAPRIHPEVAHLIPAAVHIDGTGRIQTVEQDANPQFHALLTAFEAQTGVPILLNTSFNCHEPIVATPAEAISCFLRTKMDAVVLGKRYIRRPAV